jgi:hypothetical protein
MARPSPSDSTFWVAIALEPGRPCAMSTTIAQGGRNCQGIRAPAHREGGGAQPDRPLPIDAPEDLNTKENLACRGTLPVRQIVHCDPFSDGCAPNASFGGDVPEGPPGRIHPFGVDEQGLTGKTALAARGLVAVACNSRKLDRRTD